MLNSQFKNPGLSNGIAKHIVKKKPIYEVYTKVI